MVEVGDDTGSDVELYLVFLIANSCKTESGAKSSGFTTISNLLIMLTNGSSTDTVGMKKTTKINEEIRLNDNNKKYLFFIKSSNFVTS